MSWEMQLVMAGRLLLATALGAFIGLDRELRGRDAGLGTFAIVTLGACAFAIVSEAVFTLDNTRIAAGVVTGISFLGAGTIIRGSGRIGELTTGAALWTSAAVGLSIGYGLYVLGVLVAVICILVLVLRHMTPIRSRLLRLETDVNQQQPGLQDLEPDQESAT